MTNQTESLFNNAEMALAAYADFSLITSPTSTDTKLAELRIAGMSDTQAIEFSERYPTIVSSIPNTASGFSATVFKAIDGSLTVAFRGTEFPDDPVDLTQADLQDVFYKGAALHQIVDMVNWWKQVTTAAGDFVQQYAIQSIRLDSGANPPAGSVELYTDYAAIAPATYYLVPASAVAATGELVGEADLSAVDATGHSLGGHLAMAFNALFGEQTEQVLTFNAPGVDLHLKLTQDLHLKLTHQFVGLWPKPVCFSPVFFRCVDSPLSGWLSV